MKIRRLTKKEISFIWKWREYQVELERNFREQYHRKHTFDEYIFMLRLSGDLVRKKGDVF